MRCVWFGLACGPLLWGRLASAAMRLAQSCCTGWDGRIQCYVDDPIKVACGKSSVERTVVFFRATLLWSVLGFKLAWGKAARGTTINWIGVSLQLEGSRFRTLRVALPEDKTTKVLTVLKDVQACKGMISISVLESTTGLMAWIANIIPLARPWTAMLWAALHAAKIQSAAGPKRDGARVRKGLAFKKQLTMQDGFALSQKAALQVACWTTFYSAIAMYFHRSTMESWGLPMASILCNMLFTVGNDLGSTLAGMFYGIIGSFWALLTNWLFLGFFPGGYRGEPLVQPDEKPQPTSGNQKASIFWIGLAVIWIYTFLFIALKVPETMRFWALISFTGGYAMNLLNPADNGEDVSSLLAAHPWLMAGSMLGRSVLEAAILPKMEFQHQSVYI
eukprot:Skav236810  [mRNA]  locus=scaffold80:84417:96749:+ [translate_table: standard]